MSPAAYKPSNGVVRVWNAYCAEVSKALRRKFTYLGPILETLAVLGVAVLRKLARQEGSGYDFIAYATPMALNLLGLLLLLMYCASLMASEIESGSIRMTLVRPIRRRDLVFAKLLLAMSYAVLLTACVSGISWGMAWLLGPLDGITLADEPLFSARDMAMAYGYGALLVLLPQFAACAYALMISTFTRSTGGAVGGVVGIWFLTDILKYPLGIDRFLFSTYLEMPWRVFMGRCNGLDQAWFPDTWYCVLTSSVFFVLFVSASLAGLARKDFRA